MVTLPVDVLNAIPREVLAPVDVTSGKSVTTTAPWAADTASAAALSVKEGVMKRRADLSLNAVVFIVVFIFVYCSYFYILVNRTPPRRFGE